MARTTRGVAMVDDLGASEQAKRRLKAIFQTVSGEQSIPEVCEELQINEAMFHKLRSRFLEEAVMLLEPRTPGPKRKELSPEEQEMEELRVSLKRANIELEAARVKTELALTMPHLLRRGVKKNAWRKRRAAVAAATALAETAGGAGEDPESILAGIIDGPLPVEPEKSPEDELVPPAPAEAVETESAEALTPQERRAQRHIESVYVYSQEPKPMGGEVRGAERQLDERQQEREVKKRAVAMFTFMRLFKWTTASIAKTLGVAERTLEAWRKEWRETRMQIRLRGRPPERVDADTRDAILGTLWRSCRSLGLPSMKGLFPGVAEQELEYYIKRFRYHWDHGHIPTSLQWLRVGRVWAIDYFNAPRPIEGIYEQVLTVRDMASGLEIAAVAVVRETAQATAMILERLFLEYGAPLVVKRDNGKSLAAEEVQAVLDRFGVVFLPSPAYTPSYNGSCESGNGSIKDLAAHIAHRNGRAEQWGLDDLKEAVQVMNSTFRRWGPQGPTYEEVWASRRPISEKERDAFLMLVDQGILDAGTRREIERIGEEREAAASGKKRRKIRAVSEQVRVIDQRRAVRNALVACGYLVFRRRRIPLLEQVPV